MREFALWLFGGILVVYFVGFLIGLARLALLMDEYDFGEDDGDEDA